MKWLEREEEQRDDEKIGREVEGEGEQGKGKD